VHTVSSLARDSKGQGGRGMSVLWPARREISPTTDGEEEGYEGRHPWQPCERLCLLFHQPFQPFTSAPHARNLLTVAVLSSLSIRLRSREVRSSRP
jgi:hypothetical protein